MFKVLIVTVLLVAGSHAFWWNCPTGHVADNAFSPQCTADGCVVQRGGNMIADIFFTAASADAALNVRVSALIPGSPNEIDLPVSPEFENACDHLFSGGIRVSCPTVPGTQYEWRYYAPIPAEIPAFNNGEVSFRLNGGSSLCVTARVTVT